jgi:hypothetical protein
MPYLLDPDAAIALLNGPKIVAHVRRVGHLQLRLWGVVDAELYNASSMPETSTPGNSTLAVLRPP